MTPPAQRVQFILGEEGQGDSENVHESHPIFSEMEELFLDEDGDMEWKRQLGKSLKHCVVVW